MIGPVRGPCPDESWRGWWGETPVYRVPVFVLTNHARPPLVMDGGTTFNFVTEGAAVALERAREAAGGKDVRLGGGVNVIQQYLRQRLIDEMHIAIAPVLLGGLRRRQRRRGDPRGRREEAAGCQRQAPTRVRTHVRTMSGSAE